MIRSRVYFTGLSLLFLLTASAGSAWANLAANTKIINQAKLTFTGGSASASVTVTVNLVPSQPNVTITSANGAYTAPDTPGLTDSVVITSNANGPASYTVSPTVSASTNSGGGAPANNPSVSGGTTLTIGASVTTGTSSQNYITVPAGTASGSNAVVNGIGVGSTIVFRMNSNTYSLQVSSTTDNSDGTFRLNWTSGPIPAADVPVAGVQVGEQKTVNLAVLPGTVVTSGTDITVTVHAAVSTAGVADIAATTAPPNKWTTPSTNVQFTKYVRNLAGGTGTAPATSFTINTVTSNYYTSGVTGKPGDTLEYVLVATNTGVTDISGCAILDVLPTAYVNLVTGPGPYAGKEVFYIDDTGATSTITAAGAGANQASYVAPDLNVNVGVGANASATGTIPAGKTVTVSYQVTIK